MVAQDLRKIQNKRLNPYKGLIIDVPTWVSAHDYHRQNQRLHAMSSHRHGVVTGLEVVAWDPPDNSVFIYPGIAVDPEGNTMVVPEPQRFYLNTAETGTSRLIVRYSEIGQDMTEIPGEGKSHPLYIMEGFRVEERREDLLQPHVELARILVSEKDGTVKDAYDPSFPGSNEIDDRFRTVSGPRPVGEITIGVLAYPSAAPVEGWDCHRQGIFSLVRSIRETTGYTVRLRDRVELQDELRDCDLLLMAGHEEFQLSDAEAEVLTGFFDRGGILFAEACSGGGKKQQQQDRAKGFRSAIAGMCVSLGRNLRPMERQHPAFRSYHVFGSPPAGQDGAAVVMENDCIIYSDADYGCVWQGGRREQPVARGIVRDALEFGANIAIYSQRRARLKALKLGGT
jgi:hypothetical protein